MTVVQPTSETKPSRLEAERGDGTCTALLHEREVSEPPRIPEASASGTGSLGALSALSLSAAVGLFLVSIAFTAARSDGELSTPLFWTGLLVFFVPIAVRLASVTASRRERIGLVALTGLGLYWVKVIYSPLYFSITDEFQHWRTANDIARTGRLFQENPILLVSPLYPGLESATMALMSLSGLTIFESGTLLVGVARLVLVVSLYLFYERISLSPRVAGIATLLYMCNPAFLFFDGQFAYESLGLSFAALLLFTLAHRSTQAEGSQMAVTVVGLLALGATVVTHHLTTYMLAGFLTLWACITALRRQSVLSQAGPSGTAVLTSVLGLAWLIYVANLVVAYLAPNLAGAVGDLLRLMTGNVSARELFRDRSGELPPMWEILTGYSSVAFILLVLPFGFLQLLRRRDNALCLALAAAALVYPLSLPFRLTRAGAEASSRASEFVFAAVAFVLAVGIVELWLSGRGSWARGVVFGCLAAVVFTGSLIVGWPPWARLPGPYLPGADMRSIEPQGLAAADWVRDFLGPDNRLAVDRTNRLLMGSYGRQRPVTSTVDDVYAAPLFYSTEVRATELGILSRGRIEYVVADHRVTTAPPRVNGYYERGESGIPHALDEEALQKFDLLPGTDRIFDSGEIRIYDVRWLVTELVWGQRD